MVLNAALEYARHMLARASPAMAAYAFGVEGLGELLGILFTGFGAACLVRPPLAGILVDHFHDYKFPVFVGAAASVVALIFVIMLDHKSTTSKRLESR